VPNTSAGTKPSTASPIELWAGAECTINRVGAAYFDQAQRTGHDQRLDDMDRLAALGIRRARFPVLWEREALHGASAAWQFSDQRLERLKTLGVDPIIGLVHHGSGPPDTSLCDARFPEGLGAFAGRVAARYPWVRAWTPVNEPLTTARFSALYGLWYPHARELGMFYKAVVHQVLATRASMRAIRRVNPRAELVTTEDFAQIFSTPDLADQCRYENDRRWLSLDLAFGRVDTHHPLRRELELHDVPARLLDELCAEPCVPDLVGINYYVTSDRFLDSRRERYSRSTWGGNGRQTYADVEAVRVRPEGILGHQAALESVWQRYRAPVALTEVHLACHREDQLRWLSEAWRGAEAARDAGADVRAVTIWSAFGAVGWNNLVTQPSGEYEPGVYDIRAPRPRPTALAALALRITRGEPHGVLVEPGAGWWHSNARLLHDPEESKREAARPSLLVIGPGPLARRVSALSSRRFDCILAADVASAPALLDAARAKPWALVFVPEHHDAAAALGSALNAHWTHIRARCKRPVRVLGLSSWQVFDGWSQGPYREYDGSASDGAGRSWSAFERSIGRLVCDALLIRTGLLLDPEDPADPTARHLAALRTGHVPEISAREQVSPLWVPDLVHGALDLLVDAEAGIWHLVPRTPCSAADLGRRLAAHAGVPYVARAPNERSRETRGPMRALTSDRGWPAPDLEVTLGRALAAYASGARATPSNGVSALI
jgi:dTDP-4-dehydrorhamnose reductase